ncbi:MAG: phytoene/squalene synthase family protein [Gemmatimonadaceae bacterium]|nr:phytoene/squalene synthase family protein [Gemmatimonadaceae bacterium]
MAEPSAVRPSADDAAICIAIVQKHARTFYLASRFLPPEKRRAAYALYAFCRLADDMVDEAKLAGDPSIAKRLAEYDQALTAVVHEGRPGSDGVFRELQWAVRTYGVPETVLHELVAGVARDLEPVRYDTWAQLARYCEGVASTVGEMCTYVFGVPAGDAARERALKYARTLGVAMQLTNILRDVGEDAQRGRCYFPDEDLAAFGLTRGEILQDRALAQDERWAPFMAFQIGRARTLYELARPGIALLAPDAQKCATACAVGYAGILDAIEARQYDTISARARVPQWKRISLLWTIWRSSTRRADEALAYGGEPVLGWEDAPLVAPGVARIA